jgi:large subunit ribosomal protein L21
VYAIVRCGGRQEKVAIDDVLAVDKVTGEVGSTVTLPAVLVVDDGKVVSDPGELAGYPVTAEILGESRGPKLNIMKYKSKTGYKRRLGHRQTFTQVKVTRIGDVKADQTKPAEKQDAKSPQKSPQKSTETTDKAAEKATGKSAEKPSRKPTGGKTAAKAPAKPRASRAKADKAAEKTKTADKSGEKPAGSKAEED